MGSNQALDGFVAALLHDIRKLDFSQNQFGSNHENLAQTDNPYLKTNGVDFLALVGQDVADIVQAHGGGALAGIRAATWDQARPLLTAALQRGETSLPKLALFMADRWQKAMYQIPEDKEKFGRLTKNPECYPYYGPWQRWDNSTAGGKLYQAVEKLGERNREKDRARRKGQGPTLAYPGELDLPRLLAVQEHFRAFPHTSYIPHNSLAIHHRFTAALYCFVYQRLQTLASPLDLQGLRV